MYQRTKYDHVLTGIIVGLLVPVVAYGIILYIYDLLDQFDILNPGGLAPNFRERTIGLLSIIANVIPLQIFNKRNLFNAMRGIVFPTLIFVGLWMYFYGFDLLKF